MIPLLILKSVLLGGLASWLSVIALNNIRGFKGGVASVGGLMTMHLIEQPPAIETPLLSRRVDSQRWHAVVYSVVVTMEAVTSLLLWAALIGFVGAVLGRTTQAAAGAIANVALASFLGLCFTLAVGGNWFAYYLKQGNEQLAHFAMLGLGLGAVIVINLRVA